jgi:WXG100 family type VII secretion target
MTTIGASHHAFRTAITDLTAGAEHVRGSRDRISHRVQRLLDDGWTGDAADSFAEGWGDWRQAAREVLDGLVAMGGLLEAVHQDLRHQDESSQRLLDGIAGRITERLG